jgi:CRISPR-associated endonuclease/helicase Cas3
LTCPSLSEHLVGDWEKPVAHIREGHGPTPWEPHDLETHMREVSRLATDFSASFAPPEWGTLAGLWHDLGKYRPGFQSYIRSASGFDTDSDSAPGRIKHAIVGAIHATQTHGPYGRLLAYMIAGHHSGLPDWHPDDAPGLALSQQLGEEVVALAEAKAGGAPASLLDPGASLPRPPVTEARELHFWLRMLFSCLVDADYLDTERFMGEDRNALRGDYAEISTLRNAYDRYMTENFAIADTQVKALRSEIRDYCLACASEAPGLFSLTVPTGGGKTLASLGFALHHAVRHGLKRVIYVIPYTSIIEQTADVFRSVFAGMEPVPVIEHHCNLDVDNETLSSRLAAENWDAPVIVTTNVQFFESLYASRTSRCRKLHNLAESVVVLDEAQLLPAEHLQPILDGLRQLIDRYRLSVVLSTATQPELGKTRSDPFGRVLLKGLGEARELAPDPIRLYGELERVTITLPQSPDDRRDWDSITGELEQYEQVLCIVNRRDDAEVLWRKLPMGTIHLSARMCGAHRAQVIAHVREQLQLSRPVRVVSTQLVEAGVDFDFPVVYRAMAGLDSIAQAAGRCNREGRLPGRGGRVVVFNPPKPSPSGLLLKAEQAAQLVLANSTGDPLAPANFARYFELFYGGVNSHDKNGVMRLLSGDAARGEIQFRTAAQQFRLIPDDEQQPVFVRWGEGARLIERLKREGPHRDLMRRLQRHAVTLYDYQWKRLMASGDLEMHDGFLIQTSDLLYHPDLGLLPEPPNYEPESLVF